MQLLIGHLYPDVMNLYGDRGNLIALRLRAQWRDIEVRVLPIRAGSEASLAACDLILLGGGEDRAQQAVLQDLRARAAALAEAVAQGAVVLAICGGYQLLGHAYRSLDGQELPGLGLLDVVTVAGRRRLIGNVLLQASLGELSGRSLVGFENHAGRTQLGPEAQPLGRVLAGYGNNGEDGGEGAHQGRVFGTYLHGPLLPKNPWLADYLLALALERHYSRVELAPLDDSWEDRAHGDVKQRIVKSARRARRAQGTLQALPLPPAEENSREISTR